MNTGTVRYDSDSRLYILYVASHSLRVLPFILVSTDFFCACISAQNSSFRVFFAALRICLSALTAALRSFLSSLLSLRGLVMVRAKGFG